jgi:hypothetical protein
VPLIVELDLEPHNASSAVYPQEKSYTLHHSHQGKSCPGSVPQIKDTKVDGKKQKLEMERRKKKVSFAKANSKTSNKLDEFLDAILGSRR